jgi:ATP-dependent Clp protease ATP-binding subunit ClpA
MRACSVDLDKLRGSLVNYLETEFENLVAEGSDDAKPTAGFQRVVQRAVIHVQSSGREEVTGANVLIAIFAERESHAAYFLQEQDMTRYDAVNYISHGIAKRPGVSEARPVRGVDEEADAKGNEDSKKKGEALRQPEQEGARRKDRSRYRSPRRNQPRDPGALPPSEEQSVVRRRSGRRKNCDRGGSRQAYRR